MICICLNSSPFITETIQLLLLVTAIDSRHRSRGFGQLVRARNIKTVGDLSALTPSEIKTLPIRLPKISNVKKALNIYEQQVCQGKEGSDGIEVTLQTIDKFQRNVKMNWIFDICTILLQRKGRGGDELKSLDETEMMTSELEETSIPQNQDEEDKTSNETLGL